jgi:multiple sugar transport system ATP-binding protein
MTMGQRIAVMKDGLLQQCDTPLTLYHQPANMFVAGFLGTPSMNFLEGQVVRNGARPLVDTGAFQVHLPEDRAEALQNYIGKSVVFGIRPEDIHDKALTPPSAADLDNVVRVNVDVIEPMGSVSTVFLTSGSHTLVANVDAETRAKEGAPLDVVIDAAAAHVFDKDTEAAIV